MNLKQKPQDFRVRERLRDDYLQPRGDYRVYRVSKVKATSIEAARELAYLAGVQPAEVAMAGLKDRQGQTEQYMTIARGREVFVSERGLKIEPAGFAHEAITSTDSIGNAFEIVARGLEETQLRRLRAGLDTVREFGYPNYFDEQRFGNLRHGQGWIALDLLRGDIEGGLKRLMASISRHEHPQSRAFKELVWKRWGNWKALRDVAGRFGKHHSVFDHLRKDPEDFAGAFGRIATRERVIHQFAFQSHLWNRALAGWLKERIPEPERFTLPSLEGPLVFPKGPMPVEPGWEGMLPLPGVRFEGLQDDTQRKHFTKILAKYGIEPEGFEIPHVPGFGFKADLRPLVILPEDLRARPAEPDRLNPEFRMVRFSFALPRGAYASLLVKRLIGLMPDQVDSAQAWQARRFGEAPRRGGARRRRGRGRPYRGGGPRGGFDGNRSGPGAREGNRFEGSRGRSGFGQDSHRGGSRPDRPRQDERPAGDAWERGSDDQAGSDRGGPRRRRGGGSGRGGGPRGRGSRGRGRGGARRRGGGRGRGRGRGRGHGYGGDRRPYGGGDSW